MSLFTEDRPQDLRECSSQDEPDSPPIDAGGLVGLTGLAALGGALSSVLSGCGGGGAETVAAASDGTVRALGATGAADTNVTNVTNVTNASSPVALPSRLRRPQAARFLAQAAFGGTTADIENVQIAGFEGWLSSQFAAPRSSGYVELIRPGGPDNDGDDGRTGVERALWRKLVSSPDVLRQRMTLALSEIFVISLSSVVLPNRGYACAAFLDVLEGNAFGNYRDLLLQVSTSAAMGAYLTFVGNKKADPGTGSQPDENYARELMQLFSIGLLKLDIDGTTLPKGGPPDESYTQADVLGMARVFTGWVLSNDTSTPYSRVTQPMRQVPGQHESGSKFILGEEIKPNTDGANSLIQAVDILMKHPNMGPFIGRQLIQRLVTSHPSDAYVSRVAQAFNGNATRAKGDLKATLRAVLLDPEARSAESLIDPLRGRLREPMVRFIQWARLFGLAPAPGGSYNFGNLSNPATELAQSPLRAPSVFNFFRPGFVQPNSALGDLFKTTPEFQITNESTVAGYVNFMQRVINFSLATLKPDYSALLPMATDSAALLAELNVLLAAGQISEVTLGRLKTALDTLNASTAGGALRRVQTAVLFVMVAPEYVVQK